jgi:uncharacterized protein (DUF2132 family)
MILDELVKNVGWEEMGYETGIRCFVHEPRINASLKFLRKTPWARTKVEELYLRHKQGHGAAKTTDEPS